MAKSSIDNSNEDAKKCSKCGEIKSVSLFAKNKSKKLGINSSCKACDKVYKELNKHKTIQYRINNREKLRENKRKYDIENKEKNKAYRDAYSNANRDLIREKNKKYHRENKERINNIHRNRYFENIEHIKNYHKKRYSNKREEILSRQKEYYNENKEIIKKKQTEYNKTYNKINKDRISERSREYIKKNRDKINKATRERVKSDPLFAMSKIIRCRVSSAFRKRGWGKKTKTQEMLGCDWETAKNHIEKQFKEGMTWENNTIHGWHIDHIIPIASAKTEEELIKLFHYTNLQPLWAEVNRAKRDKLNFEY